LADAGQQLLLLPPVLITLAGPVLILAFATPNPGIMARNDLFQMRYQTAVVVSGLAGYIFDFSRPVFTVSSLKALFKAISLSFMFRYCISQAFDKLILCSTHFAFHGRRLG
jgi:hypothetical protein